MSSICQTQVNIKVTEGQAQLQDPFIKSSMHLNIAVWLRDMDTKLNIYRETRLLCDNMLTYHARY